MKSFSEDEKLKEYHAQLDELRKDGVNKAILLKQEIESAKKNKMLSKEELQNLISEKKNALKEASAVEKNNAAKDKAISKEAVAYANSIAVDYVKQVNAEADNKIKEAKAEYVSKVAQINEESSKRIASLKEKVDIITAKYERKSALFDAKNHLATEIEHCKDMKKQAFSDHIQENRALRNGKTVFAENVALNFKNYIYNFKTSKFLLDNGLYLAIILFFIACIIIAPLKGAGNLFSLRNILTILEQSSTRMFYALGVAGRILIVGTG